MRILIKTFWQSIAVKVPPGIYEDNDPHLGGMAAHLIRTGQAEVLREPEADVTEEPETPVTVEPEADETEEPETPRKKRGR